MEDYEKEINTITSCLGDLWNEVRTAEARYIIDCLKTTACNMGNLVKVHDVAHKNDL